MALIDGDVTSADYAGIGGTAETVVPDERRALLLDRVSRSAMLASVVAALVIQLLLYLFGLSPLSFDATDVANDPIASCSSLTAGIWRVVASIIVSVVVAWRLCGAGGVNAAR